MTFEVCKWCLAMLSLWGVVLNIKRDRRCFLLWSATNAAWCVVDWWHGIPSQAALQAVYFGLAIWGWVKWRS